MGACAPGRYEAARPHAPCAGGPAHPAADIAAAIAAWSANVGAVHAGARTGISPLGATGGLVGAAAAVTAPPPSACRRDASHCRQLNTRRKEQHVDPYEHKRSSHPNRPPLPRSHHTRDTAVACANVRVCVVVIPARPEPLSTTTTTTTVALLAVAPCSAVASPRLMRLTCESPHRGTWQVHRADTAYNAGGTASTCGTWIHSRGSGI
jgi:hypothetical protein